MSRTDFRPRLRRPWQTMTALAAASGLAGRAAEREGVARGVILGGVLVLHLALLAALLSYRIILPEVPEGPVIRLDMPPVVVPPRRQAAGDVLLPVPVLNLRPDLPVQEEARPKEQRPLTRRQREAKIAEETLTPAIAANTLSARGFDLMAPPNYAAAYLRNRLPIYPPASRRLGEEGVVVLRAVVTPEGRSQSVEIYRSSGYARLDEAARQAVLRWSFIPAERGRQAVTAWLLIPIRFSGAGGVTVDEAAFLGG